MYKIKTSEAGEVKYLSLRESPFGIDLICWVDYHILRIHQGGKIERIRGVPEKCGFSLDEDGRVIID